MAYLTASISQLTGNYAKEAELAQTRADAYSDLLDAQLANLAATDLSYFAVISSLKDAFAEASATALANDATIAASNATQLLTEKSENEAEYNDAKSEVDATYQKAWQDAWNDAFLETLGEAATEKTDVDAITAAMQTALETAGNAYRDEIFSAYDDLANEALDLAKIYAYNQERINNGGTVATDAFENPSQDYEVCFVAGTQVLMADGSTKPIEKIKPGDQVLAAHHLNPEEKPTAATVVRFFDNGEKEVVKLLFNNQAAQSDAASQDVVTQEIVCTPGHRFYVIEKGWVNAQDLQQGDLCLSATGEKIAFLSKENLPERRRVYNFEVENAHTYFVGIFHSILSHNKCIRCGDTGYIYTNFGGTGVNIPSTQTPCPLCHNDNSNTPGVSNPIPGGSRFGAGLEAFYATFLEEVETAVYDGLNYESFGAIDRERYNELSEVNGERFYNVSRNLGYSDEAIGDGYGLAQGIAGDLLGPNAIAESITGYDLGENRALDEIERVTKGAQGASQVAGTLAGGVKFGSVWHSKNVALENANYAQKTYRNAFSRNGKFAGKTVDSLANEIQAGKVQISEVPIQIAEMENGQILILNTRSAQALTQAGVPRSQWTIVYVNDDISAMTRLYEQLQRNGLSFDGIKMPSMR